MRLRQNQLKHDIDIALAALAALINWDSLFTVPYITPEVLLLDLTAKESDPGLQYLKNSVLKKDAELRVEKNRLLPDLTISYFNGTNNYPGARHYQGFEFGLGIPLFFGEQRARIRAGQYAVDAAELLRSSYRRAYENRLNELLTSLEKYRESIAYYEQTGKFLAEELLRSAQQSFRSGEIDFFRLVQGLESAIEIQLNWLDDLYSYNNLVLEINYLTL